MLLAYRGSTAASGDERCAGTRSTAYDAPSLTDSRDVAAAPSLSPSPLAPPGGGPQFDFLSGIPSQRVCPWKRWDWGLRPAREVHYEHVISSADDACVLGEPHGNPLQSLEPCAAVALIRTIISPEYAASMHDTAVFIAVRLPVERS